MNTLTYLLYLLITGAVTIRAGWLFYHHGRLYILRLLKGDQALTQFINKALLVGYYLLNLGHLAITLRTWPEIQSLSLMIGSIAFRTGRIFLILGIIHFINMGAIYLISLRKQSISST